MPGASFAVSAPAGPRSVAPAGATRTFARRAEEVPAARRFVRDVLADHPSRCDAELLTCELVTNAVINADAPAGAPIALCVRIESDRVRVDVSDSGVGSATLRFHATQADRGAGLDGRGGYGLAIVAVTPDDLAA